MRDAETTLTELRGRLPSEAATAALATRLAPHLRAGDTLLLEGPVGAGKSALARALIQAAQAAAGVAVEEVPSPSFTLVQTYEAGDRTFWHVDLYRLGTVDDLIELGLDAAFEDAVCLIEWPERLGPEAPERGLALRLTPETGAAEGRAVELRATGSGWGAVMRAAAEALG